MIKSVLVILVVLVGFSVPADAVLIDRGTGMIYDTELGITWLQDANYVNTTGYDDILYGHDTRGQIRGEDALVWAENLEYYDPIQNVTFSDWRLPKTLPVNGFAYDYSVNHDGSSDHGCNISAPGSVFQGSTSSEMAYMFYNNLEGLGWFDLNGNGRQQYGLEDTGPFVNLHEGLYFSGTTYDPTPNGLWTFSFKSGYQQHDYLNDQDNRYAWAVRDGDYGPSVSTTQTYLTDYLTLGDTFTFDYWWEMDIEPTEGNFDVLFFNGTEWETFGWKLNFNGSSTEWETASFLVPPWLHGLDVQIKFSLFDWGQETDPTVYLRSIGSAPVPEPATIILLGTGLVGLAAGASRKKSFRS